MLLINRKRVVVSVISLFMLSFLISPFVNRYEEKRFAERCAEVWSENYEFLESAYADLNFSIWRPEEYLINSYAFAEAWYDAEDYECFANNPSGRYLNAFVVVLREYERQLKIGSRLSPPELPFKLITSDEKSHVSAICQGWMFKPVEDRCELLFNLSPNGFYRAYIDDLDYE